MVMSREEYEVAIVRIDELKQAHLGSSEAAELLELTRAVAQYVLVPHDENYLTSLVEDIGTLATFLEQMCSLGDGVFSEASEQLAQTDIRALPQTLLGLLGKTLSAARSIATLCHAGQHAEVLTLLRSMLDAVVNIKLITRGDRQANREAALRYHHACLREHAKMKSECEKDETRAAILRSLGRAGQHRVAKVLAAGDLGIEGQEGLWEAKHWAPDSAKKDDGAVYHSVGMARAYAFEYRSGSESVHAKDYTRYAPGADAARRILPALVGTGSALRQLGAAIEAVANELGVAVPAELGTLIVRAMTVRSPPLRPDGD